MVWLVKLTEGCYVLFLTAQVRSWRPTLSYTWYTALGVLLGASQLVPTWEAMNRSWRAELSRHDPARVAASAEPGPARGSVPVSRTLSARVGRCRRPADPALGAGRLSGGPDRTAALVAGLRRLELGPAPRRLARFALGLAAFGVLLAFGRHGPFAEFLVHAPLVARFRIPARYLLLVHFGLAALAAVAVDDLLGERAVDGFAGQTGSCGWSWCCWKSRCVVPRSGSGSVITLERSRPSVPLRIGFNLVVMASAAGLVALGAHWPRLAFVGMICLAIADQAVYVLRLSIWEPGSVRPIAEALRDLPSLPVVSRNHRLHFLSPRPGNPQVPGVAAPCLPAQAFLAGQALTDGYMGLAPRRHLDYERDESLRPGRSRVGVGPPRRILCPVRGPLPRVRFVTRSLVGDDPAQPRRP